MQATESSLISRVLLCLWAFAAAPTVAAQTTASFVTVVGDVYIGERKVQQDEPIDLGTTVTTRAGSFATVRVEWPVADTRCYRETMFGFGSPYKVEPPPAIVGCDGDGRVAYGGVSEKYGIALGKGDDPVSTASEEFDHLAAALSKGMIIRPGESRQATDYNAPGGTKTGSAAACARLCGDDPMCNAMTYIPDQNMCWLKADRGTAVSAPDMVSAVRKLDPKTIQLRDNAVQPRDIARRPR